MPIQNTITNFKCFNQLRNGDDFSLNTSDFTTALVANTRSKVKIEFEQRISISSNADTVDVWTTGGNTLQRTLGNFFNDGLQVGQSVEYWNDYSTRDVSPSDFTLIIDSISADGVQIQFTTVPFATLATTTTAGFTVDFTTVANDLSSLVYSFGLVDNADTFDNISLLTQDSQSFQASVISGVTNLLPKGNFKSWQSGSATVEQLSATATDVTFKISHEFVIISPLETLLQLQNNTSPDTFNGDASLKYTFRSQFRRGLNNISSEIGIVEDSLLGSTGWYDENFDGGISNYSVTSITYNSGTPIDLSGSNTVVIVIEKVSGNFNAGDFIGLYHSYLPSEQSEYTENQNTYQENFEYDFIRHELNAAQNTGTNIFKTIDSIFSGSTATITATLSYSTTQQTKLDNGDNYLLSLEIEDSTLTANSSDKVNLLVDTNQYIQDQSNSVVGLSTFSKFDILNHSQILGADTGTSTSVNWNEDGILIDFAFTLDTNKSAILNSLNFRLIATNGTDSFNLDTYNINFSGVVDSGGIQQIEVDTTRGYNLPTTGTGTQFNSVNITTGANVGGNQEYTGSFAQKIRWQDWQQNPEVAGVFFNASELNDNRNFKSSNYSGLNGYDIKLVAELDLNGVDTLGKVVNTVFTESTGVIEVNDYNVSDTGDISSATIELFDADTSAPTDFILGSKNTLFRTTWSDATPFDVSDIVYIIHRLEPYRSLGNDIEESSSLYGISDDSIILDIDSITKVGSTFVSECQIDYTKLNPNICYKLTARIQIENPVVLGFADYECETIPTVTIPPPEVQPIPQPEAPAFCGQNINFGGSGGVSDKVYQINYTGYISLLFDPYTETDKAELGKLQADNLTVNILATTDFTSTDFTTPIDVNSGLGTGGGDIDLIAFNANGERFLNQDAVGSGTNLGADAVSQFIGQAKGLYTAGNRLSEYEALTGDTNAPKRFGSVNDRLQYVTMPVSVGDKAVVRISGKGTTQWNAIVFCYQTS